MPKLSLQARQAAENRRNAQTLARTLPQEIVRPEAPQRGGTWRGGGRIAKTPPLIECHTVLPDRLVVRGYVWKRGKCRLVTEETRYTRADEVRALTRRCHVLQKREDVDRANRNRIDHETRRTISRLLVADYGIE